MASTTSLLKSAASTRKKIQAQEDAEVAFEWQNSAQTYEEFAAYSRYLEDRQSKATDPSNALGYARTLRSARRSYVSNELQRQQIAIMEGRAGTADKMESVKNLYYQAVENEDFNLAQNLISQWDSLSIKLQNEQESAAKKVATSGNKAFNKLIDSLIDGDEDVTLPNGTKVTPLSAIADDVRDTGGSSATWKAASDTMQAAASAIIDRYNSATSQDQIDKLEDKYGLGLKDLNEKLTFKVGGKNLTYQDVVNADANESFNNPIFGLKAEYNPATGRSEFKLTENKVDQVDYVRQFDQNGQEYFVPAQVRTDQPEVYFGTSDQMRDLDTQITDTGAVIGGNINKGMEGKPSAGQTEFGTRTVDRDDSQSLKNRLAALGIIASGQGNNITIKLPGENVQRQAVIQPDGSIRFFDDEGQMNEIAVIDRNIGSDAAPILAPAGQARVVSPEELSDFGTPSAFGGTLSRPSAQGERYLKDITSTPTQDLLSRNARITNIANDFSGFGSPVGAGALQGTSSVLQSAQTVQQRIRLQAERDSMLQAQQEAAQLQASQTFNINQVPVQQLTSQGILKRQLKVAPPAPTPRVVVAPPTPTPNISRVTVATPGRISSVGVDRNRYRVRVE